MARATIKALEAAAGAARKAQETADAKLARRDAMAAELADAGTNYRALAAAMGITVDGVTYVLRKVRRAQAAKE